MNNLASTRAGSIKRAVALASLAMVTYPMACAWAGESPGFYVGGAVGQAQVEVGVPNFSNFKENHSAYKLMLGIRPISLIGAEVAYFDFGHPSGILGYLPSNATMKGAAAFGLVYLPVPVVDVYAKVGIARIQTNLDMALISLCSINTPNCYVNQVNSTNTDFAVGVGAQFKFKSLALRAEYERFRAAGANPGLASVGIAWRF